MSRPAPCDPGLGPLLARASRAYRKRDDAAFRALLGQALDRAPQRLDIGIALANHHIQTGEIETAAGLFRRMLDQSPNDRDCLTCLAHWHRCLGDAAAAGRYARRLGRLHPSRREDMRMVWRAVDAALAMRMTGALPAPAVGATAIIVLGYALNPDGSMHPILLDRLEKALEAASAYPRATLIVTGGVPRRGKTEAVIMRRWLEAGGVAKSRMVEEGYARDVVENLLFSRQILDFLRIRNVVAVTSAIDVRRTAAGLDILRRATGSPWRALGVAASERSLDNFDAAGGDRVKLYRDSLRLYGLPMMGVFPQLVER